MNEIIVLQLLPYALGLYLIWTSKWRDDRVKAHLSMYSQAGHADAANVVDATLWQYQLQELQTSSLISVASTCIILLTSSKIVATGVAFFIGIAAFEAMKRLAERWGLKKPSGKETVFRIITLRRDVLARIIGTILVGSNMLAVLILEVVPSLSYGNC